MKPEPRPAAAVIPREVLSQVRRMELRTRRLVNSRFSGDYHSVFKGQGIEFAEVREYLPGDDVRTIDWNVTARLGHPYVKRYVEERELTVLFAVDVSGSQRWGTQRRFKSELVAEVVAALAMAAARNNDRVGLLAFSDRVEAFVPPRKGRRHVLRLLRDLLVLEPAGRGTNLLLPLEYAGRILRSRSVLFLLSDFQLAGPIGPFERAMAAATTTHDVVAVTLADARELHLPEVGLLRVIDPETGATLPVDTGDAGVRARFADAVAEQRARITRLLRRLGMDEIELRTGEPYAPALLGFFRRRERRLHR